MSQGVCSPTYTCNTLHMASLRGRGMGCLLWVQSYNLCYTLVIATYAISCYFRPCDKKVWHRILSNCLCDTNTFHTKKYTRYIVTILRTTIKRPIDRPWARGVKCLLREPACPSFDNVLIILWGKTMPCFIGSRHIGNNAHTPVQYGRVTAVFDTDI